MIIKIDRQLKIRLLKAIQAGKYDSDLFPEFQIEAVDLSKMSTEELITRAKSLHELDREEIKNSINNK